MYYKGMELESVTGTITRVKNGVNAWNYSISFGDHWGVMLSKRKFKTTPKVGDRLEIYVDAVIKCGCTPLAIDLNGVCQWRQKGCSESKKISLRK